MKRIFILLLVAASCTAKTESKEQTIKRLNNSASMYNSRADSLWDVAYKIENNKPLQDSLLIQATHYRVLTQKAIDSVNILSTTNQK